MAKKFVILGNYLAKNKTEYVSGWDYHFSDVGQGLPTIHQVEDYACSVLQDRSYDKALVKNGKALAKKLGVRAKDASAIIVCEKTKIAIAEHFAPEVNKSIWIVEAVE